MSDSSPPPAQTVRPGSGTDLSERDYLALVASTEDRPAASGVGEIPLDELIASILREHEAEDL